MEGSWARWPDAGRALGVAVKFRPGLSTPELVAPSVNTWNDLLTGLALGTKLFPWPPNEKPR